MMAETPNADPPAADAPVAAPVPSDAAAPRPRRLPAWTWLVVHFAFVASLAVVWHRREPWVLSEGHQDESVRTVITFLFRAGNVSRDVRRAFVVGRNSAYVWDIDRWGAVCALEDPPFSGEFSPDATRLAGMCEGNRLFIWDAVTGDKLSELVGHEGAIRACSFSSDGKLLLTYSHIPHAVRPPMLPGDNTVRLWDAATGRQLAVLGGEEEPCTSGLFSPSKNEFAVARVSGIIEVYDAATLRRTAVLGREGPCVRSIEFSASGDRIVSVDDVREVRVYEIPSGKCALVLDGRDGEANDARFAAEDTRIIAYGWHTVIWDAYDGKEFACLRWGHWNLLSFEISPDCSRAAHEASRGERFQDRIGIWHLRTQSSLAFLDYWQPNGHIVWLPSGDAFLVDTTAGLCLFRRRFPEWWWGHLCRPEVWAAIAIGAVWLLSVARWARGELAARRARLAGATPGTA